MCWYSPHSEIYLTQMYRSAFTTALQQAVGQSSIDVLTARASNKASVRSAGSELKLQSRMCYDVM